MEDLNKFDICYVPKIFDRIMPLRLVFWIQVTVNLSERILNNRLATLQSTSIPTMFCLWIILLFFKTDYNQNYILYLAERSEFLAACVRSGNVWTKFPEKPHHVGAWHGGIKGFY